MKKLKKILRYGLTFGLAAGVGMVSSLWGGRADFTRDVTGFVETAGEVATDTFLLGRLDIEIIQDALRKDPTLSSANDDVTKAICMITEKPEFHLGFSEIYQNYTGKKEYLTDTGNFDEQRYYADVEKLVEGLADFSDPIFNQGAGGVWGADRTDRTWRELNTLAGGAPFNAYAPFVEAVERINTEGPQGEPLKKALTIVAAHVISQFTPEEAHERAVSLLPTSTWEHLMVYNFIALNERGRPWGVLGQDGGGLNAAVAGAPLNSVGRGELRKSFASSVLFPLMYNGGIAKLSTNVAGAMPALPAHTGPNQDFVSYDDTALPPAATSIFHKADANAGLATARPYIDAALAFGGHNVAGLIGGSGCRGSRFAQFLGARLALNKGGNNPLVLYGLLGAFYVDSAAAGSQMHGDLQNIYQTRFRNAYLNDATNRANFRALLYKNALDLNFKGAQGAADVSVRSILGDDLMRSLSPPGTVFSGINTLADATNNNIADTLARVLGTATTGVASAAGYGVERPAVATAFQAKAQELYDNWVGDNAHVPHLVYNAANEGAFLGNDSLRTIYVEAAAPASPEASSLSKALIKDVVRFTPVDAGAVESYFKSKLAQKLLTREFWGGVAAAHDAATTPWMPAAAPGNLRTAIDGAAAAAPAGLNVAVGLALGFNHLGAPAAGRGDKARSYGIKAVVAHYLGYSVQECPLSDLVDACYYAFYTTPVAAGVAARAAHINRDYNAIRDKIIGLVWKFEAMENGLYPVKGFIYDFRHELAWIPYQKKIDAAYQDAYDTAIAADPADIAAAHTAGNMAAKNEAQRIHGQADEYDALYTAVRGVAAADNAHEVIMHIFKLKDDFKQIANDNQAFVDTNVHPVDEPLIKAVRSAFSVFTRHVDTEWLERAFDKIYAHTDATAYLPYRKLDNVEEAVAAGATREPKARDLLALLEDRGPVKRNAGWAQVLAALDGLKAGDQGLGSIDDATLGNAVKDALRLCLGDADHDLLDKGSAVGGARHPAAEVAAKTRAPTADKLNERLDNPGSRMRLLMEKLILTNDAGATVAIADATPKHIAELFRAYTMRATVLTQSWKPFDAFLDGIIAWAGGAGVPDKQKTIGYFFNAVANDHITAMQTKLLSDDLIRNGVGRAALIAAADGVLANMDNSAAAVDFNPDPDAFRDNVMYAASIRWNGALAAVRPFNGLADISRMLPRALEAYFKRGGPERLKGLYLGSCQNDATAATARTGDLKNQALRRHIADGLMDWAGAPASWKKLMDASGKKTVVAGPGPGNDLLDPADLRLTNGQMHPDFWKDTANALRARTLQDYARRVTVDADLETKAKHYIEDAVLRAPASTQALWAELKTLSESNAYHRDRAPGMHLMYDVIRRVDSGLNALYRLNYAGNDTYLESLYAAVPDGKPLPHEALLSYSFDTSKEDLERSKLLEGFASPGVPSPVLRKMAHELYNAVADGASTARVADADRMQSYAVGLALENATLFQFSSGIFGPIENVWFHDGTAAKDRALIRYHADPADHAKMQLQEQNWLSRLYEKLNVMYPIGAQVADPAVGGGAGHVKVTNVAAVPGDHRSTHNEIFALIKAYAPLLGHTEIPVGGDNATGVADPAANQVISFADWNHEVVAFREIQNLYSYAEDSVRDFIARNKNSGNPNIRNRVKFVSIVSSRLLEFLYAGVRPSEVLKVMERLYNARRDVVPAATWEAIVNEANDLEALINADNPHRAQVAPGVRQLTFPAVAGAAGPALPPYLIEVPAAASLAVSSKIPGPGDAPEGPKPNTSSTTGSSAPAAKPAAVAAPVAVASLNKAQLVDKVGSLPPAPAALDLIKGSAAQVFKKADTFLSQIIKAKGNLNKATTKEYRAVVALGFKDAINRKLFVNPKGGQVSRKGVQNTVVRLLTKKEQARIRALEARMVKAKVGSVAYEKARNERTALLKNAYVRAAKRGPATTIKSRQTGGRRPTAKRVGAKKQTVFSNRALAKAKTAA